MSNNLNKYDSYAIFKHLQSEIKGDKLVVFGIILFLLSLTIIVFPIAFIWFGMMIMYTDLPIVDYHLIDLFQHTDLFLFPYTIVLGLYFYVMYEKNTKFLGVDKTYYQKSKIFFLITIVLTLIPLLMPERHVLLFIIYIMFFILTLYNLSASYYNVTYSEAYSMHDERNRIYKSDDLGIRGMDDPFTIEDDLNRARFAVATANGGFTFVVMLIEVILDSLLYFAAISHEKHVKESAFYMDAFFENGMIVPNRKLSRYAISILTYKEYFQFTPSGIYVLEKSKRLAQKVPNAQSKQF